MTRLDANSIGPKGEEIRMTTIEQLLLANGKVIITTNKEYCVGDIVPELESITIGKAFVIETHPMRVMRVSNKQEYIDQLNTIIPRGYHIAAIGLKKRFYEVKPDKPI